MRRAGPSASLRRWLIAIALLSAVVVVAIVLVNPRPLFFDEDDYLAGTVRQLERLGFGRAFLLEYPHPAGLLFGAAHWLLAPVTGLDPTLVRLLNVLLAMGVAAAAARICSLMGARHPAACAAVFACVPTTWVLAGLALTEMIGLLLAALAWAVFFQAVLARDRAPAPRLAMALAAGLLIGLSFFSRPPLAFAAAAALPCVLLSRPDRLREVVAAVSAAVVVVGPAVLLWGGLVPPRVDFYSSSSYSIPHAIMALGYAGLLMALVCPSWYEGRWRLVAGLAMLAVLGSIVAPIVEIASLRSVAARILPDALLAIYPRMAGGLCVGMGVAFAVVTGRRLRENRTDGPWLAAATGMMLLVLAVGKVTHQFSSRYVGVAVPLMVIAAARYRRFDRAELAGAGIGSLLGALSLLSYYRGA